jgi:hypothetical protein
MLGSCQNLRTVGQMHKTAKILDHQSTTESNYLRLPLVFVFVPFQPFRGHSLNNTHAKTTQMLHL